MLCHLLAILVFIKIAIDALSVSSRTVTCVVNLILAPTQNKLVRNKIKPQKTKIAGSSLNIPHSPVFSIGF